MKHKYTEFQYGGVHDFLAHYGASLADLSIPNLIALKNQLEEYLTIAPAYAFILNLGGVEFEFAGVDEAGNLHYHVCVNLNCKCYEEDEEKENRRK